MSVSTNNKRIAKNTLFMYLRMILVMGVSLYTSRIVLEALGAKDYGIYSIVGGTVIFFSFISNSLNIALQRYFSYAIGKNDIIKLAEYFNQGFWTYIMISLVTLILCESGGLLILLYYLDIPPENKTAAFWVFQLSILNLILLFLNIPYKSIIISEERMDFFAWQGVIEAILKLGIAFLIFLFKDHKLVMYMVMFVLVSQIANQYAVYYCNRNFSYCKIKRSVSKKLIKEFISFSGWTLLSTSSNVLAHQGVSMVLNNLYGVLISAATGITNQIMNAISTFLSGFQTAFNPQITKNYAKGEFVELNNLIFRMSLYSFYLMMIISIPIIIKMNEILSLWLTIVPEWTASFSTCIIIVFVIGSYGGPFWMGMYASGKIKKYQIITSFIESLNFIIAVIILYCRVMPDWAYIVKIFIAILLLGTRIVFLKPVTKFSLKDYILKIILRSLSCYILSFCLAFFIAPVFNNYIGLFCYIILSIFISISIIYLMGLSHQDKTNINNLIKSKIPLS